MSVSLFTLGLLGLSLPLLHMSGAALCAWPACLPVCSPHCLLPCLSLDLSHLQFQNVASLPAVMELPAHLFE